jgi:hypothetical protein
LWAPCKACCKRSDLDATSATRPCDPGCLRWPGGAVRLCRWAAVESSLEFESALACGRWLLECET